MMPLKETYERTTIREYVRDADELAELLIAADPFGIDDRCSNETRHRPIASCGAVVCVSCGKVFWQ